ncbi:HET-domain-containing protein [Xylariaceae sp. FL1019]|nr:HET-domain-containing protein [Xylariaceae sp. FL1019]
MSPHPSLLAHGPKDLEEIIEFLDAGGFPDTRWSKADLQLSKDQTGRDATWLSWNTPLTRMIATKQQDAIIYLLSNGARVDFCNSCRWTPLQNAVRMGWYDGVDLLLRWGANPNKYSKQRRGDSSYQHPACPSSSPWIDFLPLHDAIRNADTRMIGLLARAGADVNKQSPSGWLPLDLALIDRQHEVMDVLIDHGAHYSQSDSKILCHPSLRKHCAEELLRAATNKSLFPAADIYPVFLSFLRICGADANLENRNGNRRMIDSDILIRNFFRLLTSAADTVNLEAHESDYCSSCFRFQTATAYQCQCLDSSCGFAQTKCFKLHSSQEAMRLSASAGCRLCHLISQALKTTHVVKISDEVDELLRKYRYIRSAHVYLHLLLPECLFVTAGDVTTVVRIDYCERTYIKKLPSIEDYHLGTASLSTAQIAKTWLEDCETQHTHVCKAPLITVLPTRVVDVGGVSQEPFLLHSEGTLGRYCALSYCWGASPGNYQTTKDKLDKYCTAIPLGTLPRTLRDAIDVCRKMSIQHIWIDALCIVQDDADDWGREAVRMDKVFTNALFTIFASVSKNSQEGLYRLHQEGYFNPQPLHLRIPKRYRDEYSGILRSSQPYWKRFMPRSGRIFPVICSYVQQAPSTLGTEGGNAIDKRAWTLQECILSKRILSFESSMIHWQCFGATAHEDGLGFSLPRRHNDFRVYEMQEFFQKHTEPKQPSKELGVIKIATGSQYLPPLDFYECLQPYFYLLEVYGHRAVTVATDRITAILGLYRQVSAPAGNEFVGGIFKGTFTLPSLLWYLKKPSMCMRIQEFPSWSWASIPPEPDTCIRFYDPICNQSIEWEAEVTSFDYQSDPAQTNIKGRIILRGRLGMLTRMEEHSRLIVDLAADEAIVTEAAKDDIWCFAIATVHYESDESLEHVMLLRQLGESLTFERIGIYQRWQSGEKTNGESPLENIALV